MSLIKKVGLKRSFKFILFTFWQLAFDLLPVHPFRIFWLKLFGAKVGSGTFIDKIDFVNLDRVGLRGLIIGNDCFIGRGVLFDLAGKVVIHNFVTLSPRVSVLSHTKVGIDGHRLLKKYPPQVKTTAFDDHSFVGLGSIILAGVNIGKDSLVAAGSVVNKSVLPHSLVAGNPAKAKKKL